MFHDVPGLTHSLKCYKCGQYNEGVGSITPCINYTAHMDPKDCPPEAEWCIQPKKLDKSPKACLIPRNTRNSVSRRTSSLESSKCANKVGETIVYDDNAASNCLGGTRTE
ncbi:hypothetical protein K0M31_005388 [Melipona bicolor]|uniref:Uncharacterized protein n=1 Tax=Melipona bicolor TaxID=60889 RepID=A0AA40KMF0_9HYME|nr:hypothetical protein K0M31_005388 [Melipona bicolor]